MQGLQALAHGAVLSTVHAHGAAAGLGIEPGHKKPHRDDRRRSQGGDAGLRRRQAGRGQGAARHLSADPRLRRPAQGDRGLDRPPLRPRRRDRLRARGAARQRLARRACSSPPCRPSGASTSTAGPRCCSPIPFYQAYLGGTYGTGCEPVFLNATAETGHLPDLDALEREPDILRRTAAFFLCSPANPQGSVAGARLHPPGAGAGARVRLHAVLRRVLLGDLHARGADRRARGRGRDARALQEPRRLQLALQALEPAGHALGLRGRRRRLPRDAGRDPQPRGPADAGARAARLGRGVVGGAARHRHPPGLPRQVRRLRPSCSAAASATGGPAAASSCGST